jgi:gluconolactonase
MTAFSRREAIPVLMLAHGGTIAPWFTSTPFGNSNLQSVNVGSLHGTRIPPLPTSSTGTSNGPRHAF